MHDKNPRPPISKDPLSNPINSLEREPTKLPKDYSNLQPLAKYEALHSHHPIPLITVCGGLAGLISDLLIHPLDVITTRQQAQLTNLAKNKYKTVYQSFRRIVAEEGFRGVYSGLSPAVLGSIASHTCYFGIYETSKRILLERNWDPTLTYFTAGAVGDAVASLIYVPSEVIKTRMQLQGKHNNPHSISPHNYRDAWHAFSEIWRSRGFHGIYNGLGATLLRDLPFTGIQFTTYESLKRVVLLEDKDQMTFVQELVLGATAGIVAGALTTPLDVIKTYLQTQTRRTVPAAEFVKLDSGIPLAPHYSGVRSALLGIYGRSGWRGLLRGIGPRCAWTGSQSMLMFVLYETFLSGC